MAKAGHLQLLEGWMRSYRPEELFDEAGRLLPELAALAPVGARRMSANPYANGDALMRPLRLPDFKLYAVAVTHPGAADSGSTLTLGNFLRDIFRENAANRNFRVFGPDETASNRLGAVFEATDRAWVAETIPGDDHLSSDGRVMEILSEHTCQGWLEGRHGFFSCYEAFIHIIDSMFNQHAKWLKVSREVPWRRPIASLNYLLTSHVWRQDHNGFSHHKSRSLPPKLEPNQCHCRREAALAAMARYGCGDKALHTRYWDLGVGEKPSRQRTRCRNGPRGRRPNARNFGCR